MNIINIYLIILNIISFTMMALDKVLAILNKQRINEFTLLTLSIFGGSLGTLLGMIICKHKIRKLKFLIIVPLSLIILIAIYKNITLIE